MKVDRFAKGVVLLNGLVPAALLAWDAATGRLGANPVNFAIRTTGILSLIFLILSLTVTPVSRLTGLVWLGQFRRMLGLYAFFHTAAHFGLYFTFDRAARVGDTLSEIAQRPYLMVGTLGLLLMAPLAVTSTNGMIKRLGPKRWKLLHVLAYPAAIAGAVHFYLLVKADVTRPLAFGAVLAALLLYRLLAHYLRLRADSWKLRNAPPPPATTAKPKAWSGQLRVTSVSDETPEVRTFRLSATDGQRLPFDFLPGQYLNLALLIDGKKVRRSYTIASPPTRTGYCEVTVKREERGLGSRHLHDAVRAGHLVDVVAPAGRFTFTGAEAGSVVLVAGGVGITPLMAKVRYLTDLGWPGDIFLVFSAKTQADVIFRRELDALRERHPNLHVTVTLTREDPGSGWAGERGRITPALLTRAVPDLAARRVHICGPTEMTDPTRQTLRDLGVPDDAIHVESFTSPSRATADPAAGAVATVNPDPADTDAGEAKVSFERSGKSAAVTDGRTVLEMAEELGVGIDSDCRAAVCGRCKVRVLSGRVVMEAEDALDATDRANGVVLACQARCVGEVAVDA